MARSLLRNGFHVSDSTSFNPLRQVYTTSLEIQVASTSSNTYGRSSPRILGNMQQSSNRNDLQLHISLDSPPHSPTFSLSPPLTPHDPPDR